MDLPDPILTVSGKQHENGGNGNQGRYGRSMMAPCREHPNELKIDQIDQKQQQGRTPQIEYLDKNGPGIEVVGFTARENMWIPGS